MFNSNHSSKARKILAKQLTWEMATALATGQKQCRVKGTMQWSRGGGTIAVALQ